MPRLASIGSSVFELAVAHERFAADDREVKRPVLVDERDDAVDELLTF